MKINKQNSEKGSLPIRGDLHLDSRAGTAIESITGFSDSSRGLGWKDLRCASRFRPSAV
jgi:hypothetical protein